jgi:hypothetical protein
MDHNSPIENHNLRALCARYREPATKPCTRCLDAPSLTEHLSMNVFYCSTECQKSDRKNHKTICNLLEDRKLLYRAGSILQEVFFVFTERTWSSIIAKVERRGQEVHIYANPRPRKCFKEADILQQFRCTSFRMDRRRT